MVAARGSAGGEAAIQRAIVAYLRAALPHGWVVQHTPNRPRNRIQGAQEKHMGAVRGWPDLAVYGRLYLDGDEKGQPYCCFFEVKAPGEKAPEYQQDIHAALLDIGWKTAVVRSVDDVRRMCWNWNLPIRETQPGGRDGKEPQAL